MRVFYASFLSTDNMKAYESLVATVDADVPNAIRAVPSQTHHLTIAFLGEVAPHAVEQYLDILQEAESLQAFPISLGQARILYSRRSPRLVCADLVDGRDRVVRLQQLLHRELERLPDPPSPAKPPHVTLARFRKRVDRGAARSVEEALARHDPSATRGDSIGSVRLVKSTLTPDGPIYESLAESKLSE